MKSAKIVLLTIICSLILFGLTGCILDDPEVVPVSQNIPTMNPLNGNNISFKHDLGDIKLVSKYDLGNYRLEDWRITDSKPILMSLSVEEQPEGSEILVEHLHADISLKSTDAQLDGLTQDSMDDNYHGTSQDGFLINKQYNYSNIFAIEGFSKDFISGWEFYAGDYGSGSIESKRLTEGNLLARGTYGSKLFVVYHVLIKKAGETKYHAESFADQVIIPSKLYVQAQQAAALAAQQAKVTDSKKE